ncbi:hypothetical protein CDAR_208321 [Caerostris darwini]|uniref:Uncharacterized protein n=1 Tax=Caerostris darwini TaxID=1538125 RepID=A0AAV4RB39_9ARAC|nr:hypothetical protein CDAR_208321 [Caerostris darwini]
MGIQDVFFIPKRAISAFVAHFSATTCHRSQAARLGIRMTPSPSSVRYSSELLRRALSVGGFKSTLKGSHGASQIE